MTDRRRQLETLRARLARQQAAIEAGLRAPHSADWGEQAQEREPEEAMATLGDAILEEIAQITAAIARMETGDYGTCVRSGGMIAAARLDALPYAATCVNCAGQTPR